MFVCFLFYLGGFCLFSWVFLFVHVFFCFCFVLFVWGLFFGTIAPGRCQFATDT